MPGTYTESNRPRRPGAYFNWVAQAEVPFPPAIGSIVALPIVHSWGPDEVPTLVGSLAEFDAIYGNFDSPGRRAVKQAFQGEGLDGVAGAGAVLVHRMTGSAGAVATKTLSNTTPAVALTLTAKYPGLKGNDFRVTVQDFAGDATKTEVILYDGTVEIERWRFPDTNITDLVAQINGTGAYAASGGSDWVTATQQITGVALGVISSSPFTSGHSGETLLAADWTNALAAIEPFRFHIFVPYDLTDAPIQATVKAWVVNLNSKGKRFMAVFGGALNELIDPANTRSATFADPNIVNVGVGSVRDTEMLDSVTGLPVVLSTSQLAPRVAGILASRGEAMSITFARMRGLELLNGATEAGILSAFDAGTVVLGRDSAVDAPVRIEKALTTYTAATDAAKPYKIYSNPKFVRTMHGYEVELTDYAARYFIGRLPVNNKTREAVVGRAQQALRAREDASVIQPGWTATLAPNASDEDEFVEVYTSLAFGRSLEQIFFKTTIR